MILVTGSKGLVGSRFVEISENKDKFHTPKSFEFDITDKSQVKAVVASFDLTAVVNFAAFTDLTEAESDRGNKNGECWRTNVEGVRNIVETLSENGKGIHFIQLSSSRVFSGDSKDKGPYDEKRQPEKDPNKLSWYGQTKLEAENLTRQYLGESATIVRLSHVIGKNYVKSNDFLNKLITLSNSGKALFKDQQLTVTYADDVSEALDKILKNKIFGTFHVSSTDTTTPLNLAGYFMEKSSKVVELRSVKLDEFNQNTGTPSYIYPKFGGLKVLETEKALGMSFKSWKQIIDKITAVS